MDPCSAIGALTEKVLTSFTQYDDKFLSSVDAIRRQLQELYDQLLIGIEPGSQVNAYTAVLLEKQVTKLKEALQKLGQEHRSIHSYVSKCGREIDKQFFTQLSSVCLRPCSYQSDVVQRRLLDQLIIRHFLTQGQLEAAECLSLEAGIDLDQSRKDDFIEMNKIIYALKNQYLEPALSWCSDHKNALEDMSSSLEFELKKMQFIQTLEKFRGDRIDHGGGNSVAEILTAARDLQPYADKHAQEIQVLMGSLLYVNSNMESSPYATLFDPINWAHLGALFSKDARRLLRLPAQSPLSIIFEAGVVAIPALMNIRKVLEERQVTGVWTQANELPIEIDLPAKHRFHSVFSCPILRQQTSEINPPMRLVCGHVISKDALNKLALQKSVAAGTLRLKCPYCPVESAVADAKQVFF